MSKNVSTSNFGLLFMEYVAKITYVENKWRWKCRRYYFSKAEEIITIGLLKCQISHLYKITKHRGTKDNICLPKRIESEDIIHAYETQKVLAAPSYLLSSLDSLSSSVLTISSCACNRFRFDPINFDTFICHSKWI